MSFSATVAHSIVVAGESVASSESFTGSSLTSVDETIAVGTDTLVNISIDVSTVKAFYAISTLAVTLETNATDATGGNTIVLVANKPYVWTTADYASFLLTQDVTRIYVTNAAGANADLKIRVLQDSTP